MTATYGSAGTAAYSAAPVTGVPPAGGYNDVIVFAVGQKENGSSTAIAQSAGPTLVKAGEKLTSVGVAGADTGPTRQAIFYRVLDGNESTTTCSFTGSSDVMWVHPFVITKTAIGSWLIDAVTGEDVTGGAAWSAVLGSLDLAIGDLCLVASTIPTDVTTPSQFTAEAIAATGMTFGAATEVGEPDSGTGNDIGGFEFIQTVTAGSPANVAPTVTATVAATNTNVYGPTVLLRLRHTEAGPQHEDTAHAYLNIGAVDVTDTISPATDMLHIYLNVGVAEVAGQRTVEGWGFGEDIQGQITETYYLPGASTYLYVNVT